ncbi:MAG: hypothetical protein F4Y18_04875 [Cenarchaeum sp. SB0663_bin_5]|nr:hypothetical protein [Cenarchaeum sp. SB0663_bin_5]
MLTSTPVLNHKVDILPLHDPSTSRSVKPGARRSLPGRRMRLRRNRGSRSRSLSMATRVEPDAESLAFTVAGSAGCRAASWTGDAQRQVLAERLLRRSDHPLRRRL